MPTSDVNLMMEGSGPDDEGSDPQGSGSRSASSAKKRTRTRTSANQLLEDVAEAKLSTSQRKTIRSYIDKNVSLYIEGLEQQSSLFEEAIGSQGFTKGERSALTRNLKSGNWDVHKAAKKGYKLDEVAKSMSLMADDYGVADTFSDEDVADYLINRVDPKKIKKETPERIQEALEEIIEDEDETFEKLDSWVGKAIKERKKANKELREKTEESFKPQREPDLTPEQIEEFNSLYGDMEDPFGDGPSTESGDPPKPPTVPPTTFDFGDEDDGEEAGREDLKKERDQLLKKQINKEFADLKKSQADKAAKEKLLISEEFKQRKEKIRSDVKEAKAGIAKSKEDETSDRIVRRLSAFQIGRSMGGSGSLFAALSEKFLFRPAEKQQADEIQSQQDFIDSKSGEDLAKLNEDILSEKFRSADEKAKKDRLFRDTKFELDNAKTPEQKREILDSLTKQLNASSSPSRTGGSAGGVGGGIGGTGGTGGTGGPRGGVGGGVGAGVGGTGGPGGPRGPGGRTPGPTGPGGMGPTGTTLGTITKTFLNTATSLAAFVGAVDFAKEAVTQYGNVLNSDQTSPSSAAPVGAATALAQKSISIGAPIAGGAIGALAGGPLGAVIGSAIGAGFSKAIEPVISAINVGNSLLERTTEQSLGPATIMERTQQQIASLFKKIENDFKLDAITAEFAQARGELGRAIQDLQADFIQRFGPLLTQLVEFLTIIVNAIPQSMEITKRSMAAMDLVKDVMTGRIITDANSIKERLDLILNGVDRTADNTEKENEDTGLPELQASLDSFFGTQDQFRPQVTVSPLAFP